MICVTKTYKSIVVHNIYHGMLRSYAFFVIFFSGLRYFGTALAKDRVKEKQAVE